MKFSHLVPLLVTLHQSFGPVMVEDETEIQEDCAGSGGLTQGAKLWGLRGQKRDVFRMHLLHCSFCATLIVAVVFWLSCFGSSLFWKA